MSFQRQKVAAGVVCQGEVFHSAMSVEISTDPHTRIRKAVCALQSGTYLLLGGTLRMKKIRRKDLLIFIIHCESVEVVDGYFEKG